MPKGPKRNVPAPRSSSEPKTLGASKRGTHSQSIAPSGATRAPVWQSERNAYSAIGGNGDGAAALCGAAAWAPAPSTVEVIPRWPWFGCLSSRASGRPTESVEGERGGHHPVWMKWRLGPSAPVTEGSVDAARVGARALHRPVDRLEVDGVVEIVLLRLADTLDVEVVDEQELLVDVRGLKKAEPGRSPDTRATPERCAADGMTADGVAGDDPSLGSGGGCREDRVPQVAVVVVGPDVETGIVPRGGRAPGCDLDDGVDVVGHRVLAHEIREQAVVARRETEAAARRVEHEPVVASALGVDLLDARQEDLVVGVLGGQV